MYSSFAAAGEAALQVARSIAKQKELRGEDDAFFVVDTRRIGAQMAEWRALLPRVEPFYAVKCNGDARLLKLLASMGAGFDCASKNEIETVLALGVSPERIVYANPCKTRNFIRHAAAAGVSLTTFDNEDELFKMAQLHPTAELVLRIAVSDPTAVCPLNIKFGCEPLTAAPRLLQRAADLGLTVVGISFHVGSGCRDPAAFALGVEHARRLFDVGEQCGHPMHIVDVGGGYPGTPSDEITFEQIARVINGALDEHFPSGCGARLIAEPGRFFAAAAFTLCCNVIAKTAVSAARVTKQESHALDEGFMYYINDGVYGSFNCILYDHFHPDIEPLFPESDESVHWSSVWGPTCDGLDLVKQQCRLPQLQVGDWLLFENMGAYTVAAGSEFNGFERPLVHYIGHDEAKQMPPMWMDDDETSEFSGTSSSSCESDYD